MRKELIQSFSDPEKLKSEGLNGTNTVAERHRTENKAISKESL